MRIGLFGGTFNPIHRGHLHIARVICAKFPLDRICMIPCALPPHKKPSGLAAASDRLQMIQLALSDSDRFTVSEVELRRSGPSYTIDTINYFFSRNPVGDELYMLVGLDAFLEMDTWKDYLQILRRISLIILARSMAKNGKSSENRKQVSDFMTTRFSEHYRFNGDQSAYLHPYLQPVYDAMNLLPLDISSTMVRQRVAKGESIDAMVPKNVADYIRSKGLYQ